MKLLIDMGNSRMKWACFDGKGLYAFGQALNGDGGAIGVDERPEEVLIASVAEGELTRRFVSELADKWNTHVALLETGKGCCGVTNGYRQPQQLGIDRWAAIVAARQQFATPLCVADCGSAMTIDAVDGNGSHLGGYIIPGLSMQRKMLQQGTAGIGDGGSPAGGEHWGRDTAACIVRGAEEAMAALLERSALNLASQLGQSVTTVVTGGDAAVILPLIGIDAVYDEHLVLKGMARMASQED